MAAKRPTGAYPKASKKANAIRIFEAGVKSGKIKSVEAGMTGAMLAKVAGKVAPKAVKKLTDAEKYAVKFVKNIKTGDVQKTLDRLPGKLKGEISQALRKAGGNRSDVYKSTKKATPVKIKGPGTDLGIKKTVTGKIKVTNNGTGNSFTVPRKTEITQKGIVKALVKKNKSR